MKHMFSVAILPIILGGCASSYPAEVTASRDPSDVTADFRRSRYHSPVAGSLPEPVKADDAKTRITPKDKKPG